MDFHPLFIIPPTAGIIKAVVIINYYPRITNELFYNISTKQI